MENTKKRKKLGLALGAGAFRGVCHIGVIEALEEHGIEIDVVTGCSMGAVIGGSYAAGIPIAEIKNTILAIKRKGKLIDFNIFTPRKGAVSGKKIHAFLNESLGDILIENAKIPFAATAVDFKKAELVTFTSGTMRDILHASMAIPGLFRPVSIGDYEMLVDGCVIENVPIEATRALGADVVIAVDPIGKPKEIKKISGIIPSLRRSLKLSAWEREKRNLEKADITITPPMQGVTVFGLKHSAKSIIEGYNHTIEVIQQIKKLLEFGNGKAMTKTTSSMSISFDK